MRKLIALLVMLFSVSACKLPAKKESSSSLLATDSLATNYKGRSDFRLVFVDRTLQSFNPNQDLLQPTAAEKRTDEITAASQLAAFKALIPFMFNAGGEKTGTEGDMLSLLMTMSNHLQKTMSQELKAVLANAGDNPVMHEIMLIPWGENETADRFYGGDKISIPATGVANVLGGTVSSTTFPDRLTKNIQDLQKRRYASSEMPAWLLGLRTFLVVSKQTSMFTIRILTGLKPFEAPFTQEDARVKFSKIVVPDVPGKGTAASFVITINLKDPNEAPMLTAEFGDFEKYDKGNFVISESGQNKKAPRLEGTANKTGLGWVGLNFTFKKIQLNLRTVQLAALDTLLSPGLAVGNNRWNSWVFGGFNVESVDKGFQDEINKTIDTQIQGQIQAANEKILDGIMTDTILKAAFARVFGREAQ